MSNEERRLSELTATFLVVASMVGTGVFTTSGLLLADLRSAPAVLLAWGLGGLLAMTGALSYAELLACAGRVAAWLRDAGVVADAVVALHSNRSRWEAQRAAARGHAERHLGPAPLRRALRGALAGVLDG